MAFILFSWSCYTHYVKREEAKTVADSKKGEIKIIGIQTIKGEYIEFSEKDPATSSNKSIEGMAIVEKELEIYRSDIDHIRGEMGKDPAEIRTKDGKIYKVISYWETEHSIVVTKMYEWISIPINQIELVWVQKSRPSRTSIFLVSVGAIAAFVVIVSSSSSSGSSVSKGSLTGSSGCCPFIYSYDGDTYMFDAEPLGGAICEGLERTEWCRLKNLKEIDEKYKIRIFNELDETQHLNEVALLVVDHPVHTAVVPDISGKIHTIAHPVILKKAYDSKGTDLMPFLSKNDRVYWTTQIEGKNPSRKDDLKDELILEFPKPQCAKKAKLVVNVCSTHWGSQVVKQYLDLYGSAIHGWYDSIKSMGPAYYQFLNMSLKDELYGLNIRVQTEKGWVSKGLIRSSGPRISKDIVFPLDLTDVSGDVLKIKLTPPANFWMINYLAVDYSDDSPISVKEMKPTSAVNNSNEDIQKVLAFDDDNYLMISNVGDYAELVFEAPPYAQGMQRSLMLKVKGYYDVHLDAKGEPQLAMIERLQKEPGFALQYAFKEYLMWRGELMKKYFSR
jgi:hypothetical protein